MLEIACILYIKSAPISCEIVIFYRHIDNWTIIQTFCLWAARPNLLSLHKWAFGPLNCFFFVENGSLMLVTAKERPIIAKSYRSIPFQTISLRGIIRLGHGQNGIFGIGLNGKEMKDSKCVLDFSFIYICNTYLFDFSLKKEKTSLFDLSFSWVKIIFKLFHKD